MNSWLRACSLRLMALTPEGRALTDAHRRMQIALGARAARISRMLWNRLDPSDIDGSQRLWLPSQLALLESSYEESEELAEEYISKYRDVEAGGRTGPFVTLPFEPAEMARMMVVHGPLRVKNYIGKGASGSDAHGKAFTKFSGMVRRQVLSGGRMAIDATANRDQQAIGWRRVTDGNPCTFCAMLASRGPVYVSKDNTDGSTMRNARGGGMKLLYHGHCGCTGEIVYGEWIPSDAERLYQQEYEKAAKQADNAGEQRTQGTVLYRMRENGIFRDSPLSRNK